MPVYLESLATSYQMKNLERSLHQFQNNRDDAMLIPASYGRMNFYKNLLNRIVAVPSQKSLSLKFKTYILI